MLARTPSWPPLRGRHFTGREVKDVFRQRKGFKLYGSERNRFSHPLGIRSSLADHTARNPCDNSTPLLNKPPQTPTTTPVGGFPPPVSPPPYVLSENWKAHLSTPICCTQGQLENPLGNWGAATHLAPLRPSLRHCGVGCLLPLGVALCGSALPRPERFLICLAGVSLYVLLAPSSRPMGVARICGASCARGPPPRACWLGGPPPLLASPASFGRAPPRWSGLRESGVRLWRAFLSADARACVHGG